MQLADDRRQQQPWERDALPQLRTRHPPAAIRADQTHDRVHAAEPARPREQLVGDWWAARAEHGRDAAIMVAARTADVDDLNSRARDRNGDRPAGRLTLDTADRRLRAGDEVLRLRHDRRVGVVNAPAQPSPPSTRPPAPSP